MKKLLLLCTLTVILISCKENTEKKKLDADATITEVTNNLSQYKGEYIHTADAAVLKGKDFIYGVVLNDLAQDLAKQVEKVKNDEFDMVPVIVKGIVHKKNAGQEGWDDVITIKEIINVSNTPSEVDIKIESKKD